ncbi:MAG: XRE family transcriptional regulator [Lachnospiraceae bacterium]|nr:XRE family transcriptional regulator [Lachnospiraceae bacterium]
MEFSELLKSYMKELHMTAKELSEVTKLSPSVISRYRSGERLPAVDSPQLDAIVRALGKKAKAMEHPTLGKKAIRAAFSEAIAAKDDTNRQLGPNLSALMDALGTTQAAMARGCGYDSSQLSRIRKGQRHPADPKHFVDAVATYVSTNYTTSEDLDKLRVLLQAPDLSTSNQVKTAIIHYLDGPSTAPQPAPQKPAPKKASIKKAAAKKTTPKKTATTFLPPQEEQDLKQLLELMDVFHLQQYLRRLSKERSCQKVVTKLTDRMTSTYRNLAETRQGLIYFLQEVAKETLPGPLYWEDDLTGGLMALSGTQKVSLFAAIIRLLQADHTLCIAQPITPNVNAVLSSIEQWLPIYMIGNMRSYRVTPGAKEDYRNLSIFTEEHILYGTSVSTKSNESIAYRKHGATEISYAMEEFQKLIRSGQPLMTVYRKHQRVDFHRYLLEYASSDRNAITYHNTLPLATMDSELLESILASNRVEESDCDRIRNYHKFLQNQLRNMEGTSKITEIIPAVSEDYFRSHPLTLDLSGLFLGAAVFYSYEEYQAHLEATRAYAANHKHVTLVEQEDLHYHHLTITCKKGQPVIVTKDASPAVQFVISDPLMVNLITQHLKHMA